MNSFREARERLLGFACVKRPRLADKPKSNRKKAHKNRPRPYVLRAYFLYVRQRFFSFEVSCWPVQRENRAGSSRHESDYSRRGTQISFPLLECRSRENFGQAPFSSA